MEKNADDRVYNRTGFIIGDSDAVRDDAGGVRFCGEPDGHGGGGRSGVNGHDVD